MSFQFQHLLRQPVTLAETAKLAAVAVAICALILAIACEMCPTGSDGSPPVRVMVRDGDTLWDLAVSHGPRAADPRRTVCRIRQANGIEGSLIRPGDMLMIPRG